MNFQSFRDVFNNLLAQSCEVEKCIAKTLPKVLGCVHSPNLKEAIESHLAESNKHDAGLEQALKSENTNLPRNGHCPVRSICNELENHLKENKPSPALDACIIAYMQQIEHIEIALYGTLKAFARQMRNSDLTEWLKNVVKEEVRADKVLTKLAQGEDFQSGINQKAA